MLNGGGLGCSWLMRAHVLGVEEVQFILVWSSSRAALGSLRQADPKQQPGHDMPADGRCTQMRALLVWTQAGRHVRAGHEDRCVRLTKAESFRGCSTGRRRPHAQPCQLRHGHKSGLRLSDVAPLSTLHDMHALHKTCSLVPF